MDVSMRARAARGLWRSAGAAIIVIGVVAVVGGAIRGGPALETPRVLPVPAVDEQQGPSTSETAVFAGGCFWGVQGVFQHVKGVSNAVSVYIHQLRRKLGADFIRNVRGVGYCVGAAPADPA